MFTIDDIREIAIQIERNGEKTYRQASGLAKDSMIADILEWMAEEEKNHARWLESIRSNRKLSEEEREIERMGRDLLQEMIADQTFSLDPEQLSRAKTFAEIIAQSRAFEKDTIRFYEFLCEIVDEDAVREQLRVIIAEEQRHFEQLGTLQDRGDIVCRSDVAD